MTEELPDSFDLVVIGTGFTESCVAAAASRVGKSVLHVDPNNFYGGVWASFSLQRFIDYITSNKSIEIRNASYDWHILSKSGDSSDSYCISDILKQSQKFNIDLTPKLLFSCGKLVNLLLSSNVCRYAEFRAVDSIYSYVQDIIINVPCSRSDIFNSQQLSIVEKRLLMKFLSICMTNTLDGQNKHNCTFEDFLEKQSLTKKIQICVKQAIAMSSPDTTYEEGLARIVLFLNSLDRYGNTPFLFPMYGCGEISQYFCRLCAVFGGMYCLNIDVENINIDEDRNCVNLQIDGRIIKSKHIVSAPGNIQKYFIQNNTPTNINNSLSRGVIICSRPVFETDKSRGGVSFIRLVENQKEVKLIQLSHLSGTCPKDTYLLHLTMTSLSDQPKNDLRPFIDSMFERQNISAACVIFSAFFTITSIASELHDESSLVYCTHAPYFELDYDKSIMDAQTIFKSLYENEEFLPRAPDPEEVVFGENNN